MEESRLRQVGIVLICAKVALVPLLFDQPADLPFTVPKALASHALAYALIGVIAGLAIRFGRSVLIRSWLHAPVLAFLIASVLAAVFAEDRLLALYGSHDRMVGLVTIADQVVLYFAIALLVRRQRELVAVMLTALGSSLLILGYEGLQLIGRDPFSWNVDPTSRPFSTIGQTTQLAEYLAVFGVGAAAVALVHNGLGRLARLALVAYALIAFGGMILTQTRSAVVGVALAGAALAALTLVAHPSRRAQVATIAGAGALAIAIVLVVFFTPLGGRLLSTVELSTTAEGESGPHLEQSVDVHIAHYEVALGMFLDRPLLGYGPDNFLAGLPSFRTENETFELQESPSTSAHGWIAQVGSTGGLLGLVSFIGVAGVAAWLTYRNGLRPLAWASFVMMVAYLGAAATTVNGVGTDWLLWATAGAVAVTTSAEPAALSPLASAARRRTSPKPRVAEPLARRIAGIACVAVALALGLTIVRGLDASRSARGSQVARLEGRTANAIALGLHATEADPLRPQYWDTLGLAYVSANRFGDAVAAFGKAAGLAPYDVRYAGDLARAYVVLAQRGDSVAGGRARDVAERAVQIDPNNPLANQTRAVVMHATGNLSEALKSNQRALSLDKSNNRDIYLTGTQVLLGLSRPAEAITLSRFGLARIPDPLNQVQLRIELARALLANGQRSEALAELDAVLKIQPNQTIALQLKAQIQATP